MGLLGVKVDYPFKRYSKVLVKPAVICWVIIAISVDARAIPIRRLRRYIQDNEEGRIFLGISASPFKRDELSSFKLHHAPTGSLTRYRDGI